MTKPTRCRCENIAQLSREAVERLSFELGEIQKIELKCYTCGGLYWVYAERKVETVKVGG